MTAHDLLYVSLRAAGFIATLHAVGVALFLVLFARELPASARAIARSGAVAALLAMGLVTAQQLLEPARLAGSLAGMADPAMHTLAFTLPAGAAHAVRLGGLGVLALGLLRSGPAAWRWMAASGALVSVASFALTGHTALLAPRPAFAALLVAHLLIVAFWFGSLLPLQTVTRAEVASRAVHVVQQFSRLATWLVPGIFLVGLVLTFVLLPGIAALDTPYGELILAKVGGFALLMLLASLNKWRFTRAIARGQADAARSLRVSMRVEWGLIAAVLAVTATMTTFFSPPES